MKGVSHNCLTWMSEYYQGPEIFYDYSIKKGFIRITADTLIQNLDL